MKSCYKSGLRDKEVLLPELGKNKLSYYGGIEAYL